MYLHQGLPNSLSVTFAVFGECDSADKLTTILYGNCPNYDNNAILVGVMTDCNQLQQAMCRLVADVALWGRLIAILLVPITDDDTQLELFLTRTPALGGLGALSHLDVIDS